MMCRVAFIVIRPVGVGGRALEVDPLAATDRLVVFHFPQRRQEAGGIRFLILGAVVVASIMSHRVGDRLQVVVGVVCHRDVGIGRRHLPNRRRRELCQVAAAIPLIVCRLTARVGRGRGQTARSPRTGGRSTRGRGGLSESAIDIPIIAPLVGQLISHDGVARRTRRIGVSPLAVRHVVVVVGVPRFRMDDVHYLLARIGVGRLEGVGVVVRGVLVADRIDQAGIRRIVPDADDLADRVRHRR